VNDYVIIEASPSLYSKRGCKITNLYSFPSSRLGMQIWKLQLPVSRSWSFGFGFAVPKLELGNQNNN